MQSILLSIEAGLVRFAQREMGGAQAGDHKLQHIAAVAFDYDRS